MSIFSNLPRELQPLVFQDLSNKDLYECVKTCKAWYSEASVFLHSEIKLSFYRHKKFLEVSELTRLDGSKIGDYVRKIEFYCLDNDHLDEQQFHRLIYNLPHLSSIRFDDRYINYINTIPKDYLKHAQEIFMETYLTHSSLISSYFFANVRFKDQITTLRLINLDIFSGRGSSKKLLTALSEFTHLKHLVIGKNGENNTTGIHLTSILNYCKNLETLDLTRATQWYIQTKNNYVHTKLSTLIIKIDYLTEQHLEYMMDHVPSLKNLDLVTNGETFEKLLIKVEPHLAKQFVQYLKKIDTIQMYRHWIMSSSRLVAKTTTESAIFWRYMRELCDDNCCCDLVIDIVSPNDRYDGISFQKKKQDISIICRMMWDCCGQWVNHLDFLLFKSISMYNVPSTINDASGNIIQLDDLYPYLISPLLEMLKQQQGRQVCSLYLKSESQVLSFCYRLSPVDGFMNNLVIHEGMFSMLGQLYPSIENLVVEECKLKEIEKKYYMDLSGFKNLRQLTFDFDAIFGHKRQALSIDFINADSTEHYLYTPSNPNVLYHRVNSSPGEVGYHVEIRHVQVQKFNFKYHGAVLPVKED